MPQLPQIDSVKAPDKIVAQATRARRFRGSTSRSSSLALLVSYGLVVVIGRDDRDYSFTNQLAGVVGNRVHGAGLGSTTAACRTTMLFLIVNVALILSPHIRGWEPTGMGAQS
ncbi:MAG: hypothetical protein ACLSGS_04250 [Adlercreutzia sp.]